MITTNLLSIIINAMDVPDPFTAIFATFGIFIVVVVVGAILIFGGTIVVFLLIFKAVMKGNKESTDTFDKQYADASKENKCEFCGKKMKYDDTECSNCGAQVWTE